VLTSNLQVMSTVVSVILAWPFICLSSFGLVIRIIWQDIAEVGIGMLR
jgi:hypothetical protein